MKTRTRRRRNDQRGLVIAGLITITALVGLAALALTAQRGLPGRSYYTVKAEFRDTANIDQFSEVRIAGNLVGQVLDSRYHAGTATLTLQLQSRIDPLPADTSARIRLKGLLGAKYVDLRPGRSRAPLAEGATIPSTRTSTAVDVFRVIGALDARRQAELQQTFGALGEGFLGRGGQVNHALGAAPALVRDVDAVARTVNARSGAAARLVPSADVLAAAFDPARRDIAEGFGPAADTLDAFAAERRALGSTLDSGPAALGGIRAGLRQTDPLVRETAGFARAATRLTAAAPSALRRATTLLRTAPAPLRDARTLLERVQAAVPPTTRLTSTLRPVIAPTLRALTNALPPLRSLGPRRCDVLGFLRNWRSLLGFGQKGGGEIGASNFVFTAPAVNFDAPSPAPAKPAILVGRNIYSAPCVAATERMP